MQLVEQDRDAPPITFDLTTRLTVDGHTALLLHLFRDGTLVLVKTIATVEHRNAVSVLLECRRDLGRRGIQQQEDDVPLPPPVIRRVAALA